LTQQKTANSVGTVKIEGGKNSRGYRSKLVLEKGRGGLEKIASATGVC